eukprot:scaffold111832_cov51-Phaeocystis_antarctica.AAC.3
MQLKALAVSTSSLHTACARARSSGGRRTASSEERCRHGVRRDVSSAMLKRREQQSVGETRAAERARRRRGCRRCPKLPRGGSSLVFSGSFSPLQELLQSLADDDGLH